MYTVCWIQDGQDRWDRFALAEDVIKLVLKIKEQGGAEDMIIFAPGTEWRDGKQFLNDMNVEK